MDKVFLPISLLFTVLIGVGGFANISSGLITFVKTGCPISHHSENLKELI